MYIVMSCHYFRHTLFLYFYFLFIVLIVLYLLGHDIGGANLMAEIVTTQNNSFFLKPRPHVRSQ